jgi:hypothetical protein
LFHDIFGNVIAKTYGGEATEALGTVKEDIGVPETKTVPTCYLHASGMTRSRSIFDRRITVVIAGNTASPLLYWLSVTFVGRSRSLSRP